LPSTTMSVGDVKCMLCEKEVALPDAICTNKAMAKGDNKQKAIYRCNCCNALMSRIYRANGKVNWVSKEARQEFFQMHSALAGEDLKKELECVTTQVEKDSIKDNDDADVIWLDDIDLKKKYEHKPAQLKALMETAETREHPSRKVKLYADVSFNTKKSKIHEAYLELKRQSTSTEMFKAPKKVKKEEAGGAAAGSKDKPVSTGQRDKLMKRVQKLEQLKEEWTQIQDYKKDEYLSTFLPKPLLQAAEKTMADVDAALAEVPVVLSDGWVGDCKGVLERASAVVEAGSISNQNVVEMVNMAIKIRGTATS